MVSDFLLYMFSRTKKLENVIKEWKSQNASHVTIVPFKRYGLKYGYLVETVSALSTVIHLSMASPEEIKRYSESRRGKLEGLGRIYFPDKGKLYMECSKVDHPLPDLNNVVKCLEKNQLKVNIKKPDPHFDFVGVKPVGLKLQVA